jgi:ribosomal-protein-alanine N-acetyltransferase
MDLISKTLISLRPLNPNDLDAFFEWSNDPTVTATLLWEPYNQKEKAREFLVNVAAAHPWLMAICHNHHPIGSISLDQGIGINACRAEVGYVLHKDYWNKGITTFALKMALEEGFRKLKISRIEAKVDPTNAASIAVLEKAGMQREGYFKNYLIHRGQLRDRIIYAKTI